MACSLKHDIALQGCNALTTPSALTRKGMKSGVSA